MKFLFPSFLFALFSIGIPIIIHLFNFRKFKKVYFPNVKFLKEVKKETQSKSRLKHLLVLISRIMAIAFLVFAFAQPYLPANKKQLITGDKVISIYIDNSFSMEAVSDEGTLLDEAKKKALEIISAYEPNDRFQILTNDFEGRHQRLVNKEEFGELLDEVQISPAVKTLSEITSRQFDMLKNADSKAKIAFILSDFQKSIANIEAVKNDTAIAVHLLPVKAQQSNNLYIDSCWFNSPVRMLNQTEELMVRIRNNSANNYENIPIKLFINGQQKTPASITIEPNATTDIKLSFSSKETGIQEGHIKLTDYPITYDDDFYFYFHVAENVRVLSINQEKESSYIQSLFGKDKFFLLNNISEKSIDYSKLSANKLIILNEIKNISSGLAQELKRFAEEGGSILVFPNSESDIASYKEFLASVNANYYNNLDSADTKTAKINLEHEIYKNVFEGIPENMDLPFIQSHFVISKSVRSNEEYLLKMQNGDILLSRYLYGKGKIYLSAVPLQSAFSNFPKHAIFVPTLYKIASHSEREGKMFYTIGKENTIEINKTVLKDENIYHITNPENNFDIIPEYRPFNGKHHLFIHNQINNAGNYKLFGGNEIIDALAFNFDRKESELSYFSPEEMLYKYESLGFDNFSILNSKAKDITQTLSEMNLGKRLWKLCIIFALLFLAIEILLLKFLK